MEWLCHLLGTGYKWRFVERCHTAFWILICGKLLSGRMEPGWMSKMIPLIFQLGNYRETWLATKGPQHEVGIPRTLTCVNEHPIERYNHSKTYGCKIVLCHQVSPNHYQSGPEVISYILLFVTSYALDSHPW